MLLAQARKRRLFVSFKIYVCVVCQHEDVFYTHILLESTYYVRTVIRIHIRN